MIFERMRPVWRQRLLGIAIGAPAGIAIAFFSVWLSWRL